MRLRLQVLSCCLFRASMALAQQTPDTTKVNQAKKHGFHILGYDAEKARDGKVLVNPFFVPGYSPDIQFTLAAGAVISFTTNKRDTLLPRSSVPITATYSSSNSFIASSAWTTYWLHDKLRINALVQYRSTRDAYYGVGYKAARSTPPDSTGFWRGSFIIQLRPLWQVERHLFTGPSLEYSYNDLWKINPLMQADPYFQRYRNHIYNTGIGGIVSYDTRDYPQNAYRGIYNSLTYTIYTPSFGGDTHYQALDFDNRFYIPLSSTRVKTLAINVRSRYEFGDAPFTSMISLGNTFDLRGFRFGQFRDYYTNYAIAEYRQKIYVDNKPTRFGFVIWGGVGAIGDNFNQGLYQQPLPDVGVGLRFEIQPRLNLRVDFGYALGASGNHTAEYFNFQEAY